MDGKALDPADWGKPVVTTSEIIITAEVGSGAVALVILLVAVAVALFFFMPAMPGLNDQAEADSVYTLKGQRNQKRLGQPIECHYGRVRVWPSYMAAPYTQNHGNDQFLYALLCVGLGRYTVHNVKVEDTPVGDFEEITYTIYNPGERVKNFPTNVQTPDTVAGIELFAPNEEDYPEDGGWSGPFPAAVPGSLTYRIELDFGCRNGLGRVTSKGGVAEATVEVEAQYRPIDDDGNPKGSGDWIDLVEDGGTYAFAREMDTLDPQRFTASFPIDDADVDRFEVRVRRHNDAEEDVKYRETIHWEALRSFNEDDRRFEQVTLIAIKAKATNNLNDSSKSGFNLEVTRELPVYDLLTGTWEREATRNPVAAVCDILRAKYGKKLPSKFLDLEKLWTLAAQLDTAGIRFDGTFDTGTNVWNALQVVLNVARAIPAVPSGRLTAVRDMPNTVPSLGFNPNNINKGTMLVSTKLVNQSDHDGLEVEYLDADDWRRKSVLCIVGTDRGIRPKQVKMLGVTNRNRAYRLGMYMRAVELYQTDNLQFETGMEGATAIFGDTIAVRHETLPSESDFVETHTDRLPPDAMGFEVIGGDSVTVITLPAIMEFEPSEAYRIALRDSLGKVQGPFACFEHPTNPYKVVLEVALDHSGYTVEADGELPLYWFGISGSEYQLAKVVKVEGGSGERIKITAVPYDDRIYNFDNAEAPPESQRYVTPKPPALPVVIGLKVRDYPGNLSLVSVSWKPAFGATSYTIHKSLDGVRYTFVARTIEAGYTMEVEPGSLWVKVRGVNEGAGPPATWTGTVGTPSTAPGIPENLRLRNPFETNLDITWDPEGLATSYIVSLYIGATRIVKKETTALALTFSRSYLLSTATAAGATLARDVIAKVQAKNTIGTSSQSAGVTFNNPVPDAPGPFVIGAPTSTNYPVTWEHDQPDDFANYKVYSSVTNGFTPGPGNLVSSPTSKAATIAAPVRPRYFVVAALDAWGTQESLSVQQVIP